MSNQSSNNIDAAAQGQAAGSQESAGGGIRDVDVLVVGAATAGLYFGGLMAAQGYKVLICDRSPEAQLGASFDIIHIAKRHFAEFGIIQPQPGDGIYVREFSRSVQRSALNNWPKDSYSHTLVLRRVPLIASLAAWAREQGAELLCETAFELPLFNDQGQICGGNLVVGVGGFGQAGDSGQATAADIHGSGSNQPGGSGQPLKVRARLVVDASGIPAVVRTQLPEGYGVENRVTGPRDQFYVVLHYADLLNPERDHIADTTTWTHYKIWSAPQLKRDGAILGVGANLGYDYAERVFQRFLEKGYLPQHRVAYLEQGSTPYCRTPYSLVADGFIALGSAACISNPWSGEGVPYGWLQCQIAAEVAATVMGAAGARAGAVEQCAANGAAAAPGSGASEAVAAPSTAANGAAAAPGAAVDRAAAAPGAAAGSSPGNIPTQAELWPINLRYAQKQGALFAKNLAMLCGATQCSEQENDYQYQKGIIYENHDEQGNSTETGSMIGKLLVGVLSGRISFGTLGRLLQASSIGEKIERHYLAYPDSPAALPAWSATAEALWAKAGSMADVAEQDYAQMLGG